MAEVAVVIPAYFSERTLGASLRAFLAQGVDVEVVVVDSAPDGASADVAEDLPGVRAIRSPTRLLPHAARNVGAHATSAPLLLFTDPDVYPAPRAVRALIECRRALGGAVVAAFAAHEGTYLDAAAHVAKFDLWLPAGGRRPVEIAPTAGLLCAREDWERTGGIPDRGMLGDTRFSWALRDAGIPLHLEPAAVFHHDHGARWTGLLRERFVRGREFAVLRRERWPGAAARAQDVVATATLVRPLRTTWRSASNAWTAGRRREAVTTLPVVASAQVAWFAGELVGLAAGPSGNGR